MRRVTKPRLAAAIVLVMAASAGCSAASSPGNGAATAPDPSGQLPSFTTQDKVERNMRDVLALAAAHAKGAPDSDRHPETVITSDPACGAQVVANTCPPQSADEEGVIYLNPVVAWKTYQQHDAAGGDAPWQHDVLITYATYLTYREIQRTDPSALKVTFSNPKAQQSTVAAKIVNVSLCKAGEVVGGLQHAMSADLSQMWTDLPTKDTNFVKGTQGKC